MPYVNDDSPDDIKALRSKIALVLFKPFRSLSDLVQSANLTGINWIKAYESWKDCRTAFDRAIMSNMDDYYYEREKAASDQGWHGTDDAEGSFTLNPLQHAAFCKIGVALLTNWLQTDPKEGCYQGANFEAELSLIQLLFFLGGAVGTGKSRVIDAMTKSCLLWRQDACRSNAIDFIGVEVLVIDEVSMLIKSEWLKLDRLLRKFKRVPGVPFGGLHIVWVGDFLQLPPVGADPICIDPASKPSYSTTDIEVFLLWRRFEDVVVLDESMRFREDPEWGEGCANARLGIWSPSFVDIINSRLVDNGNQTCRADTVFATSDNVTRTAINNAFVVEAAKQLPSGHYPVRLVANFKGSLNDLSRHDVEYTMGLPDT
ncbi:hypothetical protein PHMEG_00012943 [Phytophthora megakarya]|uniref:ATP-dependent DNA helicase n=1 Tax=Phytophthora megakarya TaxID=4795 RepID=A0A225W7G0_9STRA|nr:hypothetical protein PHMEG_00012943 [Phytophthora megakarya]